MQVLAVVSRCPKFDYIYRVKMKNLNDVLNAENLTVYGAAQLIAAETDEKLDALEKQINRHLYDTPFIDSNLEHLLLSLGYAVEIARMKP
jgi:hypothetical protein